jgi:hypothetical protein
MALVSAANNSATPSMIFGSESTGSGVVAGQTGMVNGMGNHQGTEHMGGGSFYGHHQMGGSSTSSKAGSGQRHSNSNGLNVSSTDILIDNDRRAKNNYKSLD